MARLLADENFPFPVTQELRRLDGQAKRIAAAIDAEEPLLGRLLRVNRAG